MDMKSHRKFEIAGGVNRATSRAQGSAVIFLLARNYRDVYGG
jgi:hypothetical protein